MSSLPDSLQKKRSNAALLLVALGAASILGLGACSKSESPAGDAKARAATPVTVTQAISGAIETIESTLGTLETPNDPKLAAEVAGRVASLRVKSGQAVKKGQLLAEIDATDAGLLQSADAAEVARLKTLLEQQERVVKRQTDLVARNFVSRNALDDAVAQRDALKNQLAALEARAGISSRNVGKARLTAPLDGTIDEVLVATGDYVKLGDPLLRLVTHAGLRAHLPFAENSATRLKRGQIVRLFSPALGSTPITGTLEDIRPQIGESNRSVVAIVRFPADERLRAGGSVSAEVVIDRRAEAVLVPEQAVVLRPAGRVVYLIEDGKAVQRAVQTGAREGGKVEILSGLTAGETVALDGAGFLSNGFAVTVQEAKKAGTGGKPSPAEKPAAAAPGK